MDIDIFLDLEVIQFQQQRQCVDQGFTKLEMTQLKQ